MEFASMRLDDRVAVITGGGGSLGSLAAFAMVAAGAAVVLLDTDLDKVRAVSARAGAQGGRCVGMHCDVTSAVSVDQAMRAAHRQFGRIDILFNNAGVITSKPFLDLSERDWDGAMDVTAKGAFLCSQAVVPLMKAQGGGSILNMASILAIRGMPNRSAYCSAKGAIANFTRALAVELGPFNITVNAIAPTAVVTDLNRELVRTQPHLYDAILKRTPLGRLGQPEDLAGAMVFLVSPAAAYISGQVLCIDGGFTST